MKGEELVSNWLKKRNKYGIEYNKLCRIREEELLELVVEAQRDLLNEWIKNLEGDIQKYKNLIKGTEDKERICFFSGRKAEANNIMLWLKLKLDSIQEKKELKP